MAAGDQATAAMKRVADCTALIREYEGTDLHQHLLELLESLKTSYMHDLVDVSAEELKFKQGALRQVMALHLAFSSPLISMPKV